MSSSSHSPSSPTQPGAAKEFGDRPHPSDDDDVIDLRDLFVRLGRGFHQMIGLALLGVTIAALISLALSQYSPVTTSTRVVFSFPGFERGEYPDKSKFQADDLRAPAIVAEALRRQGLDTSSDFQSKIRGALSIEGIIPPNVVKDRDRLRAAGQTPPVFVPDEYALSLTLPRSSTLTSNQRNRLLTEIVNVARDNFRRTYGQLPIAFGSAFDTLDGADLPEYEIVFDSEIRNLTAYLTAKADEAKMFRSPTTNLSFKDLLEHVNLFSQLKLNGVLALIHANGLARDRSLSLTKMDYDLRQLKFEEQHAQEDDKLVRNLLAQAQSKDQNYVLGVKSQVDAPTRRDAPMLDQGLIDSIMANDAYNFLVRRALDSGLKIAQIQADEARLTELRDNLKSFAAADATSRKAAMEEVNKALVGLKASYDQLVQQVRRTFADFVQQEYGHAIQLSDQVRTGGVLKPMAIAGIVGGFLGFALGAGLSLLGVYIGKRHA